MNDVGKLPLAALAEVRATSEDRDHPILLAFDEGDGPGASYWKAGDPGEQTIARPQEVQLALLRRRVPRPVLAQLVGRRDRRASLRPQHGGPVRS